MTRTTCLSALSGATLLAAIAASGCGSSSTVDGSGGRTASGSGGRINTGSGGQGVIIIGTGGQTGTGGAPAFDAGNPPPVDGGPVDVCMQGAACTTGFTCRTTCNVGGNPNNPGTRGCTCNNNNLVNCQGGGNACVPNDAGAPVDTGPPADARPPVDGGVNVCMVGAACTAGFTCDLACMRGGVTGVRPCTCGGNNRVNCGNNNACILPDGGTPDVPRIDAPADVPRNPDVARADVSSQ